MVTRRRQRVLAVFVALAIMCSSALAGGSGTKAAPEAGVAGWSGLAVGAAGYCPDAQEAAFLGLINQYRAENGLAAVALSAKLGAAADHHSIDMAKTGFFSHTFKDGTTWSKNIANHGYSTNTYTGENIAAGYADAASVFAMWKNSRGHNANMLNPNFTAIGIGREYGKSTRYGWYWTTTFGGIVDGGVTAC